MTTELNNVAHTGRNAFERWYVDHCPDLTCEPIGSRLFTLQLEAWQARASLPTQPAAQATPEPVLTALRETQEALDVTQCPWCGHWGQSYADSERPADYCHHEHRLKPWRMFATPAPEPVANKRECPHCNYTGSAHCGDVDDKIEANGGDPKDCSNAKVYGLRAATPEPVGEPVAWRYKIPTHGGGTAWTHTRPQPECLIEAQPLYTHPAPGVPEGWHMDREGDDVIVVRHQAVGLARATNPATSMHGQILFALCDDILQDRKSLAAAQAKGGGHG